MINFLPPTNRQDSQLSSITGKSPSRISKTMKSYVPGCWSMSFRSIARKSIVFRRNGWNVETSLMLFGMGDINGHKCCFECDDAVQACTTAALAASGFYEAQAHVQKNVWEIFIQTQVLRLNCSVNYTYNQGELLNQKSDKRPLNGDRTPRCDICTYTKVLAPIPGRWDGMLWQTSGAYIYAFHGRLQGSTRWLEHNVAISCHWHVLGGERLSF